MQGAGMRLPSENLDGYALTLLGKSCVITLTDDNFVRYDGENNRLFVPKTNAKLRLTKWLKENAERILAQATAKAAMEMGVTYKSISVTSAKTRWGSCSGKDAIHYSFRLIYAPKAVVEYVVYHELAHVRHKNHSVHFWREVEKYCPDWRTHRAWLKQNAYLMEVL